MKKYKIAFDTALLLIKDRLTEQMIIDAENNWQYFFLRNFFYGFILFCNNLSVVNYYFYLLKEDSL